MREISLERARELLGDNDISDEELTKIISDLRLFGNILYSIHIAGKEKQIENNSGNGKNVKDAA
jgi:hypothetical protein